MKNSLRLPYGLSSICSLEQAERAAQVPLRDARTVVCAIEWRLFELRAIDERAQALTTVAPLPFADV